MSHVVFHSIAIQSMHHVMSLSDPSRMTVFCNDVYSY